MTRTGYRPMTTAEPELTDSNLVREQFLDSCRSKQLLRLASWAKAQLCCDDWLSNQFVSLDNPVFLRDTIAELEFSDVEEILSTLASDKTIRAAAKNPALAKLPSKSQTFENLRSYFSESWRVLAACTLESPFPDLWPLISLEIETDFKERFHRIPEWQVHNRLLLVEFFRNCRLNSAKLVHQQLVKLHEPILSIRGSLTRIPEELPQRHVPIPIEPPRVFSSSTSSELVAAAVQASEDIDTRRGLLHRIVDGTESSTLNGLPENVREVVVEGRMRSFSMHEANASTMLFAATAEQLIRSHAERHGIEQFRPTRPISADILARRLHREGYLPETAFEAARELFGGKAINLRNRASHGAMIDTEAKWLESVLDHGGSIPALPQLEWTDDDSSPFMTANLARNLLTDIAAGIDSEPTEHMRWAEWFDLDEVVAHGQRLPLDVANSVAEGQYWTTKIHTFLNATLPVVDLFHRVATISWLQDSTPRETGAPDYAVGQYFGQTVFETLYRSIAQAMGFPILKLARNRESVSVQYRILASDSDGLARSEVINAICESVDSAQRPSAARTLEYAIKLRNIASHGAVFALSQEQRLAIGNVYWKAVQLLCLAGEWHFTREAAYYSYRNRGCTIHGQDVEDWQQAELTIANLIRDRDDSPRKYATLRNLGIIAPDQLNRHSILNLLPNR